MRYLLPCCPIRRRKYWACHINHTFGTVSAWCKVYLYI